MPPVTPPPVVPGWFCQEGKMRTVLLRFRTWWYLNFVYPKIVAMRIRQLS